MQKLASMRLTTQRQVILEELLKVTSHPTANEVYDMVRRLDHIEIVLDNNHGIPATN